MSTISARMPGKRRDVARPLILIADDTMDTREMYALYLSMMGYAVETANDGREAVVKALTLRPDVIVMDLQMPDLDGWGAMRELRGHAETASIPVIVLTGHDFKAYLKHSAIAEGASAFLMKPTFPDQLEREIAAHLQERSNRSRLIR